MTIRTAEAEWNGSCHSSGHSSGQMRLGSGAYDGPYDFRSRMGDGKGARRMVHSQDRSRNRSMGPDARGSCLRRVRAERQEPLPSVVRLVGRRLHLNAKLL